MLVLAPEGVDLFTNSSTWKQQGKHQTLDRIDQQSPASKGQAAAKDNPRQLELIHAVST